MTQVGQFRACLTRPPAEPARQTWQTAQMNDPFAASVQRASTLLDDHHHAGRRGLIKRGDLIGSVEQGIQAANIPQGR